MIRQAGQATVATPQANRWWAWLAALVYSVACIGGLYLLSGCVGAGWDLQPLRLAAALFLLLPFALNLAFGQSGSRWRLVGAVVGWLLAAGGWLFTPARPDAWNLRQAWQSRQYLQQCWAQPALEDLKYANHYARTLHTLQKDFPSLAAPLERQWRQWAEAMLTLIGQRFETIAPQDVHAARLLYLQTHPLVHALPEYRQAVDGLWHSWLQRSVAARLEELRLLPPGQWDRFQRTAPLRRQLLTYDPAAGPQLLEAERQWIGRTLQHHFAQADQQIAQQPRRLRETCRQLKEHLRRLKTLEAEDPVLTLALQQVFDWAQRAAVREVLMHLEARRYLLAYGVARMHALDWLPVVQPWGPTYRRRLESLRDTARFLAVLAERVPETAPAPRPAEPETAPSPRSAMPD
jgi:hypothetical protein